MVTFFLSFLIVLIHVFISHNWSLDEHLVSLEGFSTRSLYTPPIFLFMGYSGRHLVVGYRSVLFIHFLFRVLIFPLCSSCGSLVFFRPVMLMYEDSNITHEKGLGVDCPQAK